MLTPLLRLTRRLATDIRALGALIVLILAFVWAVQPNAFGLGQRGDPTSPPIIKTTSETVVPDAAAGILGKHTEPQVVPEEPVTWSGAIGLILKVGVVIALIYLSARGLQFLMVRVGVKLPSDSLIEVIHTTSLGPRKSLHVLAIGNRLLLVGSTDQSIGVLSEISDPLEVVQLRERAGVSTPDTSTDGHFARRLDDALNTPTGDVDRGHEASVNFGSFDSTVSEETDDRGASLRSTLDRLRASRSRLQQQTDAVRRTTTPDPQVISGGTEASPVRPTQSAATAAVAALRTANRAAAQQAYGRAQKSTEDQTE